MNVIFLDFDGVLTTVHKSSNQDIEKRIKILSDICKECNCKVVIEASAKDSINEETMETDNKWIKTIFNYFKKYEIECIGRTPNIEIEIEKNCYIPMWKEDEIIEYLSKHPEIEHYCVIDDDDRYPSDLDKVRKHLVKTIYYSDNPEEEGLLEKHKQEIREKLKIDNEIKKLIKIK